VSEVLEWIELNCLIAKMDKLEPLLKEIRADHESLMVMMRANHKKIITGQVGLIAMMRASQEEIRAAVIALLSAQDHDEGFGNEIQGIRRELEMQLAEDKTWARHGALRCWMMLSATPSD
jgi:hypothetical protein